MLLGDLFVDPESFASGGPTLKRCFVCLFVLGFFLNRGERIKIALKAGHLRPPVKRHLNGTI